MSASSNGHVPVIELLCNRHAAIDALSNDNMSALCIACLLADVEAVRELLARGANVDLGVPPPILMACVELPENIRKDQDMSTFWARRCEIVTKLVRANANLIVAWQGYGPLQLAQHNKQPAIVAVLDEAFWQLSGIEEDEEEGVI
jgi:ankyrin repeat protein